MHRCSSRRILLLSVLTLLLWSATRGAGADSPVVRAVLFYSPSCGACHKVISDHLPPLLDQYGGRLQIIVINAADASGRTLYDAATDKFNIAPEHQGVPRLVIGGAVLVGSLEIPEQFPMLIERYLAAGGVDWPDIPGLAAGIAQAEAAQPTATQLATMPTFSFLAAGGSAEGFRARFDRDPVGNGLSLTVLAGMVVAVVWVVAQRPWRARGKRTTVSHSWREWAVPLLGVVGLIVASYLAYVETWQVQAVCGPVGDCNAVQQSEYALLFGVIPVGLLGVFGYMAILVAWAIYRLRLGRIGQWAGLAVCVMTAGGTLFSIYLTFLEPFVIGATCSWCLSSAVIMTLLLLTTAPVCRNANSRSD